MLKISNYFVLVKKKTDYHNILDLKKIQRQYCFSTISPECVWSHVTGHSVSLLGKNDSFNLKPLLSGQHSRRSVDIQATKARTEARLDSSCVPQ